jgi:hypothetical protein
MKKILFILFICSVRAANAGLVINEFVTAGSSDWVELHLNSKIAEKMNIADLYVTMYYGTNERLSDAPVSIHSYDRPETPYDDRFIVVHLAAPGIPDETDLTGDTNLNGCIDVYCNNYYGSLWNTECAVAIDTDDDPSNGGIIDFIYYSNRDGDPNETISYYVKDAIKQGQWAADSINDLLSSSFYIGRTGLASFQSVSRNGCDTNSAADFCLGNFQTPGRPNISGMLFAGTDLIKPLRKKVTIVPNHYIFGKSEIPLFVFFPCTIRYRIYSSIATLVLESPEIPCQNPGIFTINWDHYTNKNQAPTGLYICKINALNSILHLNETKTVYIIVSRYR